MHAFGTSTREAQTGGSESEDSPLYKVTSRTVRAMIEFLNQTPPQIEVLGFFWFFYGHVFGRNYVNLKEVGLKLAQGQFTQSP